MNRTTYISDRKLRLPPVAAWHGWEEGQGFAVNPSDNENRYHYAKLVVCPVNKWALQVVGSSEHGSILNISPGHMRNRRIFLLHWKPALIPESERHE